LALVNRCAASDIYQIYSFPEVLTIQRARKLGNKIWPTKVDELGHLPSERVIDNGRCHQRGKPLLYCSLYGETALAEVRAEKGEQYVIATFSVPVGFSVIRIGDFDYYRRTFQTSIGSAEQESSKRYIALRDRGDDWLIPALIDAFLADEFIKPAITQTDYKITSAFADILLNHLHQSEKVDAIMYPSVAFREGANFAVRPEAYKTKLKLIESETIIVEITEHLGYGIYGLSQLAKLSPVNNESRLIWK
jgi:hypothetical protein